MLKKVLCTREGKILVAIVGGAFLLAIAVIGRMTFFGGEIRYNIPIKEWPASLFILQTILGIAYSMVFTIIISMPFAFYFLDAKKTD